MPLENSPGHKYFRLTLLLMAALSVYRLMVMGFLGLGDSEAYYFAWSRHLALSYYDHPPMIAYLIALFRKIGLAPLWIRFASFLFFNATTLLCYFFSKKIFASERAGFYAVVFINITPIFAIGGLTAVPDIPLSFFWFLSIVILYKILLEGISERRQKRYLYLLGIVLGLGFLSKYFAVCMILNIIVLLWKKEYRPWLLRKELYLSGLLALSIASPVIIWNIEHDWPSFVYHFSTRHGALSLRTMGINLGKLLGGQMGYLAPFILFAFIYVSLLLWRDYKHNRNLLLKSPVAHFLLSTSVPTILFFYLIILITNNAEPHWPAVGYFSLITACAGAYHVLRQNPDTARKIRKFGYLTLWTSVIIMGILHIYMMTPLLIKLVPQKYYNARVDISNELYGWPQVGEEIGALMQKQAVKTGQAPFIFSYHYTMCGQISYALKGAFEVYCPSYRLDQFAFMTKLSDVYHKDGLFIGDNRFNKHPGELFNCRNLTFQKGVDIYRGSRLVRTFNIYLCQDFAGKKT